MKRGRPRKYDPTIPAHIDQLKVPKGAYWDRRDKVWYTLIKDGARQRRIRIASGKATLADIHREIETLAGIDRSTIEWMADEFEQSDRWKKLAPRTQEGYRYARGALASTKTRVGRTFIQLPSDSVQRVHIQQLIDAIAKTHPTKANAVKRYLSRLYTWGMQRGKCKERENPAKGVEQAEEAKQVNVPDRATMLRFIDFMRRRGSIPSRHHGSVAPYLWALAVIAYRCRLRGIEAVHLTDDLAMAEGLRTDRRKGSNDNVVRWFPELREAWDALHAYRAKVWAAKPGFVVPINPEKRALVVASHGGPLKRSALKSAWTRAMDQAIEAQVLTERFGMHALKHRGVTDTAGTKHVKQEGSGHKSAAMVDIYDHELPLVDAAGLQFDGAKDASNGPLEFVRKRRK